MEYLINFTEFHIIFCKILTEVALEEKIYKRFYWNL